jgi:hypothetical protein
MGRYLSLLFLIIGCGSLGQWHARKRVTPHVKRVVQRETAVKTAVKPGIYGEGYGERQGVGADELHVGIIHSV